MSNVLSEAAAAERRRIKRMQLEEQLRQLDEEEAAESYSNSYRPTGIAYASQSGSALSWTGRNEPQQHNSNAYNSGYEPAYDPNGQAYAAGPAPTGRRNDVQGERYYDSRTAQRDAYVPAVQSSSAPGYRSRQDSSQPTARTAQQQQHALPVPSKEQVHDYLIQHMNHRHGLMTGWNIDGVVFDVYELFSTVIRAGGSSIVTGRSLWPVVATHLGVAAVSGSNGMRSSIAAGDQFRDFFLQHLGGLELLWDQTKGPSARSGAGQAQPSTQDARRTILTAQTRQVSAQQQQRNAVSDRSSSHVAHSQQTSSQARIAQPQQAQPTTYWQNDNYYGATNGTGRMASTEPQQQPGATSSRVHQPYSSSERYTAQQVQSIRGMHGTSSYRTTQSQMPQNMPTTVAPADLRLHQPKASRPIHMSEPEMPVPDLRPPTPPSSAPLPAPPVADEASADTSTKPKKKRVRVSKPKVAAPASQPGEAAATVATGPVEAAPAAEGTQQPSGAKPAKAPRKRKPKVKLGPDGQPLPPPTASAPADPQASTSDIRAPASNILEPSAPNSSTPKSKSKPPKSADPTSSKKVQITPLKKLLLPLRKPIIPPGTPISSGAVDEFLSFADLVHSRKMPLPPPGPGLVPDLTGGPEQQYASRCQELRVSVRLTRGQEGYRELTMTEIGFWNRLVPLLKRNGGIIIPGPEHYRKHGETPWVMPAPIAQSGSTPNGPKRAIGRPKFPRDEDGRIIRPPPRLNADGTLWVKPPRLNADGTPYVRPPKLDAEGNPIPPRLNADGTPLVQDRKRKREEGQVMGSESRPRYRAAGRPRTTGNGTDNAFGIAVDIVPIPQKKYKTKAILAAEAEAAAAETGAVTGMNGNGQAPLSDTAGPAAEASAAASSTTAGNDGTAAPMGDTAEARLASAIATAQAASTNLAKAINHTAPQSVPRTATKVGPKGIPAAMLGKFRTRDSKGPLKPRPVYFISSPKKNPAVTALSGYASPMRSISLSAGPGTQAKLRKADFVMWTPRDKMPKKFKVPPTVVMSAMTRSQPTPGRGGPRPEGAPRLGRPPGPRTLALIAAREESSDPPPRRGRAPGRNSLGLSSSQPSAGSSRPSANLPRRAYLESVEINSPPRSQLSRFVDSQVTPTVGRRRTTAAPATAPTPFRHATRSSAALATPTRRHTRALGPAATPVVPSSLPIARRARPRAASIDPPPGSQLLMRTRRGTAITPAALQENATAGPSRRALRSQRSPSVEIIDSPPRRKRARLATPSSPPPASTTRRGRSAPQPSVPTRPASRPTANKQPARSTRSRPLVMTRGMRYVTNARKPVGRVSVAASRAAARGKSIRSAAKTKAAPKLAPATPGRQAGIQAPRSTVRAARPAPRIVLSVSSSPEPSPSPEPQPVSLVGRGIPTVELPLSRKRKVVPAPAEGVPVNRARVVLRISRSRRSDLISRGYYDPFRDDCSDDDEYEQRRAYSGLRPVKVSRATKAYNARPSVPEALPMRFLMRAGPGIIEPWRTVLDEATLLRRASEQECGWKGCDAVLASEELLRRHVETRRHAAQGMLEGGPTGTQVLYRCHWYGCEEPCFEQETGLLQHIFARHVSRVLACPYYDCDLNSPTISHLARHVMKHHDGPNAEPRPLVDLTARLEPDDKVLDDALPSAARTDQLTTPAVIPSIHRNAFRNDWVRQKVADRCVAGENPTMKVLHPAHMLEHAEDPDIVLANARPPIAFADISDMDDEAEEDNDEEDGPGGPSDGDDLDDADDADVEDDMNLDPQRQAREAMDDYLDQLAEGDLDGDEEMEAIADGDYDVDMEGPFDGAVGAEEDDQWEDEEDEADPADPQRALRLAIEDLANEARALNGGGGNDGFMIEDDYRHLDDNAGPVDLDVDIDVDLDLDELNTSDDLPTASAGSDDAAGQAPANALTGNEVASGIMSAVDPALRVNDVDQHPSDVLVDAVPVLAQATDHPAAEADVVTGSEPTSPSPDAAAAQSSVSQPAGTTVGVAQAMETTMVKTQITAAVTEQPITDEQEGPAEKVEVVQGIQNTSEALQIEIPEDVPPLTAGLSVAASLDDEAPLSTPRVADQGNLEDVPLQMAEQGDQPPEPNGLEAEEDAGGETGSVSKQVVYDLDRAEPGVATSGV